MPVNYIYGFTDAVQARVDDFTYTLRPKIRDFLSKPRLPTWLPPESVDDETRRFYNDLGVPLVNGKPSLLLHNLGVTPNSNADHLFRGQKHTILCNTSGAGKTRLLLEGLSRRWGFYFVIAQDDDGIGAPDLEAAIEGMSRASDWRDNSQATAFRRISKVILARWIVFKTFIQVAKELEGVVPQDNIQRDWLLFQILPVVNIYGRDPFSALISLALDSVSFDVLEYSSLTLGPWSVLGSSFDATADPFFYVIDQAQVAGLQYMGEFRGRDNIKKWPVLHPIIKHIIDFTPKVIKVIVSGTGFSRELLRTLVRHQGVAMDSTMFDVIHSTGDFSDPGTQSLFISHYLPPSFLTSDSGIRLKTRIYDWLRGRHTFTVRFLEELMRGSWHKDRPASPHKLLDSYVQRLADFTPLDSDEMTLREEEDVRPVDIGGTFEWDRVTIRPRLVDDLAQTICSFITRGDPLTWWSIPEDGSRTSVSPEQESLVEYGVARFVPEGGESKITIEEPLVLISIIRHFESNSRILESQRCLQDAQGVESEGAVLLAMTRLLQNQRQLRSIFEFFGESPSWADCTAQIVARKSSGSFEAFAIDKLTIMRSPFVFSAKSPEDVKCWLESGEAGWCIPGNLMGPDLMTRIRLSNGGLFVLVIQAKCHSAGNVDTGSADVSAAAIRSLIPSRFFHSLIQRNLVNKTRQLEVEQHIESMLGAINHGDCFPGLQYNILRVVTAFPLGADFKSSGGAVQKALGEDRHPLTALPRAALIAELATCQDRKSLLGQLNKELKRARAELEEGSDDEAEDDVGQLNRKLKRTRAELDEGSDDEAEDDEGSDDEAEDGVDQLNRKLKTRSEIDEGSDDFLRMT